MAHYQHGGLQTHSIGDTYPWGVVVVANNYEGYCYAKNLVTGENHAFRHHYSSNVEAEFYGAHGRAEKDCRRKSSAAVTKDAAFAELGAASEPAKHLAEYKILIPVSRNSDREYHKSELHKTFKEWLLQAFGGYTVGEFVSGVWLDENNKRVSDVSNTYYVATDNPDLLLGWLPHWAAKFDQNCIYVAKVSGDVRLIPASVI